jgi:hypothetical protein
MLHREKDVKHQIEDANLQFIVLLQLAVERVEFLEENGYLFGSIKMFLKNSKVKYENFIKQVFKAQDTVEGNSALDATNKLFVMQERVELALQNQYVLTVDERRRRARKILKQMYLAQYKEMGLHKSMPPILLNSLRRKAVSETLSQMKEKNLFNF